MIATFLSISLLSHFENIGFSASEPDSSSGIGNLAFFFLGGLVIAEDRPVTMEGGPLPLESDDLLVDQCVQLVDHCHLK